MTKTCCLDCIATAEECSTPNCRTEPRVSWCNQKPNVRYYEAEYPKINKEVCNGTCDRFKPKGV